jgi:hypothetical protein
MGFEWKKRLLDARLSLCPTSSYRCALSTDPESRCGIHPSTRKLRRITSRQWLLWNPPAQRNTGSQHVTDRRVDTVQGAAQTGRTSDWLEARGKSSRTLGRKSLCMHECDCAPHTHRNWHGPGESEMRSECDIVMPRGRPLGFWDNAITYFLTADLPQEPSIRVLW